MFDYMMTKEQIKIRDEARDFVKWVPRQMILDMDTDKIKFPKEFLQEAGRRNLLGCRYPKKWGGRDLDWVTTCMLMEEVGTLGYEFACVFGVGAELVCDAIILHGTDEQKEKYVKPLLRVKYSRRSALPNRAVVRISSELQPKLKIRAIIIF